MVQTFCNLGDTIGVNGGVDASVTTRVKIGRSKFREMLLLLTSRISSLPTKGRGHEACIPSAMINGSETWLVKAKDLCCMERNNTRRIWWKGNVSLKNRVPLNVDKD